MSHDTPPCLEKDDGGREDNDQPPSLPRIANSTIYDLASPELKMHFDIAGGGDPNPRPTLYELEVGSLSRLGKIGTNVSAWHEAIETMGLQGAILAALITDAKLTDPKTPVLRPGAYFRGLTRAAQAGELNLLASFMGLLARREKENA